MQTRGMSAVSRLVAILLCLLMTLTAAPLCSSGADQSQPSPDGSAKKPSQGFQVSKDTGIQHAVPKKPVRIKLHRNAKGDYSWDLTGDSVDDIVKADRRLRKLLDIE